MQMHLVFLLFPLYVWRCRAADRIGFRLAVAMNTVSLRADESLARSQSPDACHLDKSTSLTPLPASCFQNPEEN
jgi:hypothetical protein